MLNLKPCPFCGGKAILKNEDIGVTVKYTVSYVTCQDCGASTYMFKISTEHSSDERAIIAWQAREPSFIPTVEGEERNG